MAEQSRGFGQAIGPVAASETRKEEAESPVPESQIYYSSTLLEQANSLYLVAAKADQEQRYEEACRLYLVVTQRLESALQRKFYADEMDPAVRQNCVRSREWMLGRAQQIRTWLSQKNHYP